jgi:hypothetical protein
MGFDAGTIVDALEWDFTKYGAGSGTAPEPTDQMIERFKRKFFHIAKGTSAQAAKQLQLLSEEEAETPKTLTDAIATLDTVRGDNAAEAELRKALIQICAEVCSNEPRVDQLDKLPHRPLQAFVGWLLGELVAPKGYANVSIASLGLNNTSRVTT